MIRTLTTTNTIIEVGKRHTICLRRRINSTASCISTIQPQVPTDGGHDVTGSSAGDTVGRCVVDCLPSKCGRVEPPQVDGKDYMCHAVMNRTHTSHEPYEHHIKHSHLSRQEAHSLSHLRNNNCVTGEEHGSPSPRGDSSRSPPCIHRSIPTEVMT